MEDSNVSITRGIVMSWLEANNVPDSKSLAGAIVNQLASQHLLVSRDKVGPELAGAIISLRAFQMAAHSMGLSDPRIKQAIAMVIDAALQDKSV